MNKLTTQQLDQLKSNYAYRLVDNMDMDGLITIACEAIEQNLKNYDEVDVREEIEECYGLSDLLDMIAEVKR